MRWASRIKLPRPELGPASCWPRRCWWRPWASERERLIRKRNGLACGGRGRAHAEMVAPVADALRAAGSFVEVLERSGSSKGQDRPDNGCVQGRQAARGGAQRRGRQPSPARYLPSTLSAAGGHPSEHGRPDPARVRTRWSRWSPDVGPGEASSARRPDFSTFCAAIRRNSTPGA